MMAQYVFKWPLSCEVGRVGNCDPFVIPFLFGADPMTPLAESAQNWSERSSHTLMPEEPMRH